ncbi:MAG: hypothetical protein ACRCX2_36915 [Paraclostridium sp.]
MFNLFSKKETDVEIRERLLGLTKDIDCGIFTPPMDAQVALNELKNHLLGRDWYVVDPLNQEQVNSIIVYEIEKKYRGVR